MPYTNSNPGGGTQTDHDDSSDYFNDGPMDKEDPGGGRPGGEQTAVVPKSLCPGMEPGEEMVVRIEQVNEDSYVVSYAPEHGGDDDHSDTKDQTDKARPSDGPMDEGMMD